MEDYKRILTNVHDKNLDDLYNECPIKYIQSLDYLVNENNTLSKDITRTSFLGGNYNLFDCLDEKTKNILYKIWVVKENLGIDCYPILSKILDLKEIIEIYDNFNDQHLFLNDINNFTLEKKYYYECAKFLNMKDLLFFKECKYDKYVNLIFICQGERNRLNEKRKNEIQKIETNKYLNFISFNVDKYNGELEGFTHQNKQKKYTIKELSTIDINPKDRYGVLLYLNNKVIDVFFATNVCKKIGERIETNGGDSVYIQKLDNSSFESTLKIELSMFYNISTGKENYLRKINYKYATLNKAKKIYMKKYGFTESSFKKLYNKLDTNIGYLKILDNGDKLVDKIKLHEYILKSINTVDNNFA